MSLSFYPPMILEGDLTPDSFGLEVTELCQEIHDACEGFGTDEKGLLTAMGSMNPETRCKVSIKYKEVYGKELKAVMKSECGSRNLGTALQCLAVPVDETDCDMIEKVCKGMGTNEQLLYTIEFIGSNT